MHSPLRSYLANRVASAPKTDEEIRAECRRAYHETGIILLKPEWLTSWPDKTQLQLLADKTFGKRKGA